MVDKKGDQSYISRQNLSATSCVVKKIGTTLTHTEKGLEESDLRHTCRHATDS